LLYLVEFHPFTWGFGDDDLTLEYDYFRDPEGVSFDEGGTYADLQATTVHNRTVESQHPLGEIVSAVIDAGLRLEFLHEHDYTLFLAGRSSRSTASTSSAFQPDGPGCR
jgi:hypothetical protein